MLQRYIIPISFTAKKPKRYLKLQAMVTDVLKKPASQLPQSSEIKGPNNLAAISVATVKNDNGGKKKRLQNSEFRGR